MSISIAPKYAVAVLFSDQAPTFVDVQYSSWMNMVVLSSRLEALRLRLDRIFGHAMNSLIDGEGQKPRVFLLHELHFLPKESSQAKPACSGCANKIE